MFIKIIVEYACNLKIIKIKNCCIWIKKSRLENDWESMCLCLSSLSWNMHLIKKKNNNKQFLYQIHLVYMTRIQHVFWYWLQSTLPMFIKLIVEYACHLKIIKYLHHSKSLREWLESTYLCLSNVSWNMRVI